jgi:hypothetical protein
VTGGVVKSTEEGKGSEGRSSEGGGREGGDREGRESEGRGSEGREESVKSTKRMISEADRNVSVYQYLIIL